MNRTCCLLLLSVILCVSRTVFARSIGDQDTVYYVSADQMPEPVGGMAVISRSVHYPESARKDRIEGTVYVEVFLDEQGRVLRAGVVRGVRSDLDRAALEAVSGVKFTQGTIQGRPVRVRVSVPIRFKLNGTFPETREATVSEPTVQIVEGPPKLREMIEYPQLAILAGIQGQVFVTFVLDDAQNISEMRVIRGIGAGCENRVLCALASYRFPVDLTYRGRTQTELSAIVEFKLPAKK